MDTPDRIDGLPPAPAPAHWALAPRPAADAFAELPAPAAAAFSPKVAWRAVRRHWWQILAAWAVTSAGLVALAYTRIKPTYESTAWLKVDPGVRSLLAGSRSGPTDLGISLETQVQLLTSPDVLGTALQDSKVAALPRVRASLDPETELRNELRVAIIPRTQLIQVSMTSESPTEPPVIIGAVVDAYLKASSGWIDEETRIQLDQLKAMKKKFATDQANQRDALVALTKNAAAVQASPSGEGKVVSAETYAQLKQQIGSIDIDLIAAESRQRVLEEAQRRPRNAAARPRGAATPSGDIDRAAAAAFQADPEVRDLLRSMAQARQRLEDAQRVARDSSDLAVQKARRSHDRLDGEYRSLWARRLPVIRAALARGDDPARTNGPATEDPLEAELREAQLRVQELKLQKEMLGKKLEELEVDTRNEGKEALELRFANADLTYTEEMLKAIDKNIDQLDYEARSGNKINLIAPAKANFKPQSNRRLMIMAVAPLATLAAVLGLFLLVEIRSARVADPDDLPARVRLDVIGVVPPLPGPSTARGPRALRDEKRRVEEFVQSLDHLRVTLCASTGGEAGRRCVLITSACGGEGKTTLAAQLAGRCANAGLLTLLVDADLRRPSLGELLEVPEGPGLADVLLGDADPEAAMVVIGNAGGFHLLPAGTPGHDPARLLQGDRLRTLVAQFRATFDVVIIDAPPVLAVPDALLLGRWVDGAVLAVRHDASRYPLVERANRRLASIGIPVLGAVVSGVRSMEAGYGVYSYAPAGGRGEDRDA